MDKDTLEIGENILFHLTVCNVGDEDIEFQGDYSVGMEAWLFSNPEGLGRTELLARESPIAEHSLYFHFIGLHPAMSYSSGEGQTGLGVPGEYALVALDGPDADFAWQGANRDYSGAIASFTVVPEPCTLLVVTGGACICVLRRPRRCR
jgi:hypothetical protein